MLMTPTKKCQEIHVALVFNKQNVFSTILFIMAGIAILVKFGFILIFVVFQQICMVSEQIFALCSSLEKQ